ncbi:DJ-1/YajL/PfpI superfamily, includes chaperone protein YajL (former ThiJ), parkinsonism-associated protein DJ-1, peptidases PfpI, Hsp31 [hydrothermal vent metagenome]|uniref:DJ-1/YajL/PfpI superfamily, includes chaperone protein YajL (Former ThiJ), parkinsonism-associated protein DJ-1, peptidases PfpI, Hsp31 n=1 Tax=hydrothermal vent metagenome TaxID=652676 RepID=A0A3B0QYK8_9ZZZZ
MKRALIPVAPGFEEVEAIAVIDVLRRAGVEVTTATTNTSAKETVEGRCAVRIKADTTLDEAAKGPCFDILILPGGAACTETLLKDKRIELIIEKHRENDSFIAAICAAPLVLSKADVTSGKVVTCHPSVRDKVEAKEITNDRVVIDGKLITSQGPGTAVEFAFTLVELLCGKEKAAEVNKGFLAELP